jgi:two-component system OmpR family response regulator
VFSRDELLELAPGRDDVPFDRSIDHRIARLRRKLGDDGRHQALIRSIRGRGYAYAG